MTEASDKNTLAYLLQQAAAASPPEGLTLQQLCALMGDRGSAARLLVLVLPFVLPIVIPGISTPFGLLMAWIGAQYGWREKLHLPAWLGRQQLSAHRLQQLSRGLYQVEAWLGRWMHRRWLWLVHTIWIHRLAGLCIMSCGLALSLPLPLPFANLVVALPVLLLAMAQLAEDGILLLIGILSSALGMTGLGAIMAFAWHRLGGG